MRIPLATTMTTPTETNANNYVKDSIDAGEEINDENNKGFFIDMSM